MKLLNNELDKSAARAQAQRDAERGTPDLETFLQTRAPEPSALAQLTEPETFTVTTHTERETTDEIEAQVVVAKLEKIKHTNPHVLQFLRGLAAVVDLIAFTLGFYKALRMSLIESVLYGVLLTATAFHLTRKMSQAIKKQHWFAVVAIGIPYLIFVGGIVAFRQATNASPDDSTAFNFGVGILFAALSTIPAWAAESWREERQNALPALIGHEHITARLRRHERAQDTMVAQMTRERQDSAALHQRREQLRAQYTLEFRSAFARLHPGEPSPL